MKKNPFILLGLGAIVASLAVWGFMAGRKELALERAREAPVQTPSRVVAHDGGTAVVFDAATQKRADIAVAVAQKTAQRAEIEALATVLSSQELVDVRNAHVAANTQLDKAKASMEASRREYERVRTLHAEDRNLSDRALETAQAAFRGDDAIARGAAQAVDTVQRSAQQKWGAVLASAAVANTPLFRRLSEQRDVLLRVAAPSGAGVSKPPASVRLDTGDGVRRTGRLIAASPQADPRIQGPTYFYAAPAEGLLPGSNVTAYLPSGAQRTGETVPAEAVVWWQGKAWVYVQSAPDRFARRELPEMAPVSEGWFVPGDFQGARLVVRGAQTLLSEELRAQIQVGEQGK